MLDGISINDRATPGCVNPPTVRLVEAIEKLASPLTANKAISSAEEVRQGDVTKVNHTLGMSIITRRHAGPAAMSSRTLAVTERMKAS